MRSRRKLIAAISAVMAVFLMLGISGCKKSKSSSKSNSKTSTSKAKQTKKAKRPKEQMICPADWSNNQTVSVCYVVENGQRHYAIYPLVSTGELADVSITDGRTFKHISGTVAFGEDFPLSENVFKLSVSDNDRALVVKVNRAEMVAQDLIGGYYIYVNKTVDGKQWISAFPHNNPIAANSVKLFLKACDGQSEQAFTLPFEPKVNDLVGEEEFTLKQPQTGQFGPIELKQGTPRLLITSSGEQQEGTLKGLDKVFSTC